MNSSIAYSNWITKNGALQSCARMKNTSLQAGSVLESVSSCDGWGVQLTETPVRLVISVLVDEKPKGPLMT